MRTSWGWGLPSYREYETGIEPSSRHEAVPVFVPQSPALAGRMPQSLGRRHSLSAVQMPEQAPKQQRTVLSPLFVSKFLKVKERLSVSLESHAFTLSILIFTN